MLMASPVFWLGLILAPVAALLSDFSIKTLMNTVFKSVTDQVCEREINLQRSESGKLLDGRRDSRAKYGNLLRSLFNFILITFLLYSDLLRLLGCYAAFATYSDVPTPLPMELVDKLNSSFHVNKE